MEKKKFKLRVITVLLFILLFLIISFISLRGNYLQYKELGDNYVDVFFTNLRYKYIIFGINFVLLYFIIYFTNRGIKKGLKTFFEKDNKEFPKILNKSIAFIFSAIISSVMSNVLMKKVLLCLSNASFGVTDSVFGFDISFFVFQKPLIQTIIMYFMIIIIGLTIYMAIYYVIVFSKYFDGVEGKMIRNSLLIKKITRNILLIVICIALLTTLNITEILFGKMLTIKNTTDSSQDIEIVGAGYTDIIIQGWGYLIFSVVMIIATKRAINGFNKNDSVKVLKNLAIIPGYLVGMFIVIFIFNLIFVNSNKLDKEKTYLENNIKYTKAAYNINIDEEIIENSGTISQNEVEENIDIINNIRIVNSDVVLKNLEENQTGTGYYSYRNANIAKYNILGEDKLLYIAPREITNSGRTYNNKTYEYTHGIGQIVIDSTSVTENGLLKYIQKDISGSDEQLGTLNRQIYFGLETNDIIATGTKNNKEYDYTDDNGLEYTSEYEGSAGLKLNFLDRLILGLEKGNLKLAFSSEITNESKILLNRNILKRAKIAMPYLIYDEEPYTVVGEDGRIKWVIDAYTVSNQYPYSQYISIEHDKVREKINYIRNSIKVIVDSYDGTIKFYITDKTDPIAMAYRSVYPTLFEDLNTEISEDISEHFIYPRYLYDVQAKLLKIYHNVKADILYRTDDLWDFAKYNSTIMPKSSGNLLDPYYTMVNSDEKQKIGLIQIYTPESKQNMIAYLVGTTDGSKNELKLYKYSQDSNIVGPMQLDNQIEQDEVISSEIKSLNTTGTKVTKDMVVVPINNTLLYVESIYQTMLNEESKIPSLKKIVVASGNKVAIGNNLEEALNNLLSKQASNIEIDNTDDIDGVIDAIIKANKNLLESTGNNDWELMGSDFNRLQKLINTLEKLKTEQDKQKEDVIQSNKNNNEEEIYENILKNELI